MKVLFTPTTGILNINIQTRKRGNVIPMYTAHKNYEIYIMHTGMRYMYVGHSLYRVCPGDAVMISSKVPHRSFGDVGFSGICLEFSKEYISDNFNEKTYDKIISCFKKDIITIHNKDDLDKIYNYADAALNKTLDPNKCLDEITDLLNFYKPDSDPKSKMFIESDKSHIGNFIQQHYTEITCLDDICDSLNISKGHLCRTFKKATGSTVTDYINALRIQQAGNLLATTSMSIGKIAILCGYNNIQYFNRIFKKLIEETPRDFRKHANESGKYYSDF